MVETQDRSTFTEKDREDIVKIRETLAVQGQQLTQLLLQSSQTTQQLAQQSTQINVITTSLEVMKNDQSNWRNDINSWRSDINDWRSTLPNNFIPRSEHIAARHEERISELESISQQQISTNSNNKAEIMEWFSSHWLALSGFSISLIVAILTILSYIHVLK